MWFRLLSSVQLQLLPEDYGWQPKPLWLGIHWQLVGLVEQLLDAVRLVDVLLEVGLDRCHQPPWESEITGRVLLGTAL